ncbi:DUF554 family protein [Salipaludibacillus sp. LMS25]|uniref:DUF554 family protein n=1 Tax=Salipaludibacillus sp. LMS25 TaxID=2924031 RepID=UPI0020D03745|nr:DUF554 family protein [Salipaludibacillus sp. LMS25]
MKAIGLVVIMLGLTMALEGQQFLITIFSLTRGGVIGERITIEGKLNERGIWLERRMKQTGAAKWQRGL